MPPKPSKPSKPINPVNVFRGPLAYITGRPEFKEPVKKQSINQLLLDTAVVAPLPILPPPPPIDEEKPRRSRRQIPSAPVSTKSHRPASAEVFEEADEEIIRPELGPDDSQSRRSASPAASRLSRIGPSTRSRHRDLGRSVYDDGDHHEARRSRRDESSSQAYGGGTSKHNRSRRHPSSYSNYDDGDEPRSYHRSDRSERSYRDRSRDRHYERSYNYGNAFAMPMPMPQIQPIVIYPPTSNGSGCGNHHYSCHDHSCHQQQYSRSTRARIEAPDPVNTPISVVASALEANALPAALPAPSSPPSEISATSSRSKSSRAMSYKWYTATQPLLM